MEVRSESPLGQGNSKNLGEIVYGKLNLFVSQYALSHIAPFWKGSHKWLFERFPPLNATLLEENLETWSEKIWIL